MPMSRTHPDDKPKRSRVRSRRAMALVLSLAVMLAGPAWPQVRLPSLGESASDEMSVSAERRLGEQIMREARRDPDYLDDPVLLEYLQSVWNPLVHAARELGNITPDIDANFPFEAFLVRDRTVNAFALPGGYVGVNLGLINLTASADEQAARFLLVSGRPLGEPVAWYGPIVMNTREELRVAFEEYQNGTFIKKGKGVE
jgi:predicted Zn-dependent protease